MTEPGGILEHVRRGYLSHTDFAIYCLLLLEADHYTGVWWGSAKALGTYNFPQNTARRGLEKLEKNGHIKRFPRPGVHSNYPILINKYPIAEGQHKGQLLDAKQTTSPDSLVFTAPQVGKHPATRAQASPSPLAYEGKFLRVTESQDKALGEAFPWVDRPSQYRQMDSWLLANPTRRPKSCVRFAHNWFSKVPVIGGRNIAEERDEQNLRTLGLIGNTGKA